MGSLKFDRLEKIYPNRSEAVKKLSEISFQYSQPVVVRYKIGSSIRMILAIGSEDSNFEILGDSDMTKESFRLFTYTRNSFDISDLDSINFSLMGELPKINDISIIKTVISEVHHDTISFIYSNNNIWIPIGDKLSTSRIIIKEDITPDYPGTAGENLLEGLRKIALGSKRLDRSIIEDSEKIIEVTEGGKILTDIKLKFLEQDLYLLGKDNVIIDKIPINTYPSLAKYDSKTETLIFIWEVFDESGNLREEKIEIPFSILIDEWKPENTDSLILEKEKVLDGKDILKGIVKLYIPDSNSEKKNSIEIIKDGGLYSPDVIDGASNEYSSLLKIENIIKTIKDDWAIKNSESSDTIDLTISSEGILSGDVKIDQKTIISGKDGIKINIDEKSIQYNNKTNSLSVGRIDCGTY